VVEVEHDNNLYRVVFDGQPTYVETCNFSSAVDIWREYVCHENQWTYPDSNIEPESVELIHEQGVVRGDF
jgi:hypothetical protein